MRPASLLAPLALLFAACSERAPVAPSTTGPPSSEAQPLPNADQAQWDRQERLARRLALAMNRADLRAALLEATANSPYPEGKVHLQGLLASVPGLGASLAAATGETVLDVIRDADASTSLEVYLPVPEHRAAWQGGRNLLVATAIQDADTPVAFDLRGRRQLLDPTIPPATPVIALVPAEQPFHSTVGRLAECEDCPMSEDEGGSSGGSGSGTTPSAPGLYMTYASFVSTFEGWLKGSPEFEVHILGPAEGSLSLASLQCAGEHAGGPYTFDQNSKTWNGNVVLFSQAQLDDFKTRFPDQALRVVILEDDDGPCEIKTKGNNLSDLLKAVDDAYRSWTGGTSKTTPFGKYFSSALSVHSALQTAASWLRTNDEIVGTAIEDDIVGLSWAGANWIVKGEHSVTNGGIHLTMR